MSHSLTPESFREAADCLKVLAHPKRLEIISLLLEKKRTVGVIAGLVGLSSPMTSEHLRHMERCGFIVGKRASRNVVYEVVEPHLKEIMSCVRRRFSHRE